MQDQPTDVRCALFDGVDDGLPERLAPCPVPFVPVDEAVRRVLDEAAHDVLARGRHGRIHQGRDDHVDVRTPTEAPGLCVVVRQLHVVDAGAEADRSAQVLARTGQAREVG